MKIQMHIVISNKTDQPTEYRILRSDQTNTINAIVLVKK